MNLLALIFGIVSIVLLAIDWSRSRSLVTAGLIAFVAMVMVQAIVITDDAVTWTW